MPVNDRIPVEIERAGELLSLGLPGTVRRLHQPSDHVVLISRQMALSAIQDLVRLNHFNPGRPAHFSLLGPDVLPDWADSYGWRRIDPDQLAVDGFDRVDSPSVVYLENEDPWADSVLASLRRAFPANRFFVRPVQGGSDHGCESLLRSHDRLPWDRLEQLARALHQVYWVEQLNRDTSAAVAPAARHWNELDEEDRLQNLWLALQLPTKVAGLGFRIGPWPNSSPRLTEDEIDTLSQVEHERWMAVRRVSGWHFAGHRDDHLRLHPDLRAFHELPKVQRQLDRLLVTVTAAALTQVGLGMRRMVDVVLVSDSGHLDHCRRKVALAQLDRLRCELPDRCVRVNIREEVAIDDLLSALRRNDPDVVIRLLAEDATNDSPIPQIHADEWLIGDRSSIDDLLREPGWIRIDTSSGR